MVKNNFLSIFLLFNIAIYTTCVSSNNNNYSKINDIEYIVLSNGTLVDKRISQKMIDRMFLRFEAIENGDLNTFRATLGDMQDGVDLYYQIGIIYKYFDDFFNFEKEDIENAGAYNGELHHEFINALFYDDYPIKNRNTDLYIVKIEIITTGGIMVLSNNNRNEEMVHYFYYY